MINGGAFGSSERTSFPYTVSCVASTADKNEMNINVDNKSAKVSEFLEEIDQIFSERVIPCVKAEKDKGKTKGLRRTKFIK